MSLCDLPKEIDTFSNFFITRTIHMANRQGHIHTLLTAFELPRSIIQGPFGPIQPISTIQGDKLEVS